MIRDFSATSSPITSRFPPLFLAPEAALLRSEENGVARTCERKHTVAADFIRQAHHAADRFDSMKSLRQQVGTQVLKIACICLAQDATLLTRNLADFKPLPGLRAENWLD